MRAPDDYPFDAAGPVGQYWLVHGAGFTVRRADGRKLGMVEEVVVDHLRGCAEALIVRPRRLSLRRRRRTIDAAAVAAVSPESQRFLLHSVPSRTAVWRARVEELRRRLAAACVVAGRRSRQVARTALLAGVALGGRTRRGGQRLESWLAAGSRPVERALLAVQRLLGRAGLAAAVRLGAATRIAARILGELGASAAARAAAASRKAATRATRAAAPPEVREPGTAQWQSDADGSLARERRGEAPTQRAARVRRRVGVGWNAGPGRRSRRG
jgi:hypothetical protein